MPLLHVMVSLLLGVILLDVLVLLLYNTDFITAWTDVITTSILRSLLIITSCTNAITEVLISLSYCYDITDIMY